MAAKNQVSEDFGVAFDNIEKTIEFNSAWTKGYSGYWDGAITGEQAISLNAGEVAKTIDGHGRRAIFIGTPSGAVVLFDRYRPENGEPCGRINYQVPDCKKLRWFFGQAGQCNLHQLYPFIEPGNPSNNVGVALSNGYPHTRKCRLVKPKLIEKSFTSFFISLFKEKHHV